MTLAKSSPREAQMAQAEELLADHAARPSFAKGFYFGDFRASVLPAYPEFLANDESSRMAAELRDFCQTSIDPVAIDRQAEIPAAVIAGLGRLGVLGACLPRSCGGRGLSQSQYCRLLEVLGGHCASTALFVNAHHSIGPRALVLFGTPEQQQKWLPNLASGEWISAFALTEPEAGSDAGNVQSTATPTPDGDGYLLNGEKRWITNGGISKVLTVMARTPHRSGGTKVTAFIVTSDMPGFQVIEQRMPKCGVRGTATSRLAFRNLLVPKENVLGKLGQGLKVALTVLDFGRTTFGASCTGVAKFCIDRAVRHANSRVQFQQSLGSFELVKEKLAWMQAHTYAMEACTYQTAALIDADAADYMLETAMLKVFSTEALWRIINDTFQIHGGLAYFLDQPFERLLRDARINTIGEGANDVLRVFIALVGLRDVGLDLEAVLGNIKNPFAGLSHLGRFMGRKLNGLVTPAGVNVRSAELEPAAARLAKQIGAFARAGERLLATHQKEIIDRQYQLGRMADVATELYVATCVLRRLDSELQRRGFAGAERRMSQSAAHYYLDAASRRMRRNLAELWDNNDAATTDLANQMLRGSAAE